MPGGKKSLQRYRDLSPNCGDDDDDDDIDDDSDDGDNFYHDGGMTKLLRQVRPCDHESISKRIRRWQQPTYVSCGS